MKKIGFAILLLCGAVMSLLCILFMPEPFDLWLGLLCGVSTAAFLFFPRSKKNAKISIAGFKWTINDFCWGWLITGQTGSGKTACAMRNILHALFTVVPDWGGAVVDQKGQFYEIVAGIAHHYHLENKLVILRVGPEESPARYNILSYPGISWSSYAALIIDTSFLKEGIIKTKRNALHIMDNKNIRINNKLFIYKICLQTSIKYMAKYQQETLYHVS